MRKMLEQMKEDGVTLWDVVAVSAMFGFIWYLLFAGIVEGAF